MYSLACSLPLGPFLFLAFFFLSGCTPAAINQNTTNKQRNAMSLPASPSPCSFASFVFGFDFLRLLQVHSIQHAEEKTHSLTCNVVFMFFSLGLLLADAELGLQDNRVVDLVVHAWLLPSKNTLSEYPEQCCYFDFRVVARGALCLGLALNVALGQAGIYARALVCKRSGKSHSPSPSPTPRLF
jgi:hypothetical protein